MDQLKPPSPPEFDATNLATTWRRWKVALQLYVDLVLEGKEEIVKVKMFRYLIGHKGREILDTLTLPAETEASPRTLAQLIKAFDEYCEPKKNETVERYKFFTRDQEQGETIDKYVTELRLLTARCNFGNLEDSMLKDRIVCGIKDNALRERLLRENALDLQKCIDICRASQLSKERTKTLEKSESSTVHALRPQTKSKTRKQSDQATKQQYPMCSFCGYNHKPGRSNCPAFGEVCKKCGKKNHFQKMCRNKGPSRVHSLQADYYESDTEDNDYEEIKSLTLINKTSSDQVHTVDGDGKFKTHLYATMMIGGRPIKFQLDTGATCNVITANLLNETHEVAPFDEVLSMYNKTTL